MTKTIALVCAVLATAGCVGPGTPERPGSSTAARGYAIITSTKLLLVTGDTVRFSAEDSFAPGFAQLAWSGDGRYAVATSGTDAAKRTLTVMDSRDGTVKRLPCPECQDPVGISGSRVVLADSQRSLSILDLSLGTQSKIQSQVRFYSLGLRVLDASGDRVIVAGADSDMVSAYGGPEDLYEVRLSGETKSMGSSESNVPVAARLGPDGRVALISGWHSGACATGSTVRMLAPQGVLSDALKPPEVQIPTVGEEKGPYVFYEDVWWEPDGRLFAIAKAWMCEDTGGPMNPEQPPVFFCASDGAKWTQVQDPPAARAVLARWRDGTLTVVHDGKPTKIAAEAIAVALPA